MHINRNKSKKIKVRDRTKSIKKDLSVKEKSLLVNYQISDWNQLKKELVSWNTVLDRPSVKKVRELVLA